MQPYAGLIISPGGWLMMMAAQEAHEGTHGQAGVNGLNVLFHIL